MKDQHPNYKADFPILNKDFQGEPRIYLDSAATSQKPQAVVDAISNFYLTNNANVHRGVGSMSQVATDKYEAARQTVADFIHAPSSRNVVFTRSTTESLNWIAAGYAKKILQPGDEILISVAEHHSNLIPWQQVAKETWTTLKFVDLNAQGQVDLADFNHKLSKHTKIVAITQVSNVLGSINPIAEIAKLTHQVGAKLVVDAAQAAPHLALDVQALDADFLAFSGHKMLGPTGIGVLYGKMEVLEAMDPVQFGGEMIDEVSQQTATWQPVPLKFEAGTPNIVGAIGLAAAIDYLQQIGMDQVAKMEHELVTTCLAELKQIEGVTVYGPQNPADHTGVVAFNLAGIHPHDVSTGLDLEGIEVRAGHHCAQPLMQALGVESTVRASFYFYNTQADVQKLIEAIKNVKEFFENGIA
ncbi:aminotransferase class V-fold PLP-dependent enzyme [Fructilactobacillus frigidiflavus]|uniref:aminotransferase class V-fold PLP-dependent enzyme n=1 Tax=Fructilactobacillus frigidiflavus TaxID=3242688 RepID=UPI003756FCF5